MKKTIKTLLMAALLTTAFSKTAFAEIPSINNKQSDDAVISYLAEGEDKTAANLLNEQKEFINSDRIYTSDINYGSVKADSYFEGQDKEVIRKYYAYYNINSTILNYNKNLVEAVNNGDMPFLKEYLKENSGLFNTVKEKVAASQKTGIKENFIDSMVLDYSYDKDKQLYKVNVYEEYDVINADKTVKNTKYNWVYTLDSNYNIIDRTEGTEKNLEQYSRLTIEVQKENLENYNINYHMYAVNKQGKKQWEKVWKNIPMTELEPASPYVISDNGIIYIVVEGNLYALDKYTGKEKWGKVSVGSCAHAPVIDVDGTIYCTGYYGPFITAVNPDGTIKWSKDVEDIYWPYETILYDKFIYVYFSGGVESENAYVVFDKDGNVADLVTGEEVSTEVNTDDIVNIVKGGHFNYYNTYSIGEAFDNFFLYPYWTYFESTDGSDIVEFNGQCYYDDMLVNILIQFNVNTSDGSFQMSYAGMDDNPINDYLLQGLMDKIFE